MRIYNLPWSGRFVAYLPTKQRGKTKLVKVVKQFKTKAKTREQAMDNVKITIPNYSQLVYPSFIFGGPKRAMSQVVSSALRNAGPEES